MKAILLALLVAVAFAHTLKDCTRQQTNAALEDGTFYPWVYTGVINYRLNESVKTTHPDLCDSWKFPYCVLSNQQSDGYRTGDAATWEFACAECGSTCDCPIGKYCYRMDSEHDDFGRCVSYTDVLGQTCTADSGGDADYAGSQNQVPFFASERTCSKYVIWTPRMDYQDAGLQWHLKNHTYATEMWNGVCVKGKCHECQSAWGDNRQPGPCGGCPQVYSWHACDPEDRYGRRVCYGDAFHYYSGIAAAAPAAALVVVLAAMAL